jgi:hypothetical protein
MQKYLPADIEAGEAFDSAMVARHCNMSHVLSGLVAEAGPDQFVIAPHRAIEEDQRRAGQPRLQIVVDGRAGGEKIEVLAGSLVANPKPDCVARTVVARGINLAFQIPRAFAGNGEWQDFDAGR